MRYKIKDVAKINERAINKKYNGTINYIDTSSVTDNIFNNPKVYSSIKEAPSRARRVANLGDTIISTVRPNMKHTGFIDKVKYKNCIYSTGFAVVTPLKDRVDPFYLYLVLTNNKNTELLQSIGETSTSTYPSVKPSDIENLEHDFPNINKQKEISTTIKMLENKIYLNNKINTNLNSLLECIFNNYYHHKNDTVSTKLELISEVRSANRIFAKEYRNEGIPFLRGKEISLLSQGNSPTDTLFISIEKYKKLKNIPKAKDILVTSVGTIGNIYQVENFRLPFYYKDGNIIQITPHKGFENYIYLWLNSKFGDKEIVSATIGSTQKALTISAIKKFKLYILNNHELQRFNHIVNPLIKQIQQNHEENDFLQDLKSTLLKRYF